MMGPWYMYGWGNGLGWLSSIAFWVLVAFFIVMLFRLIGDQHSEEEHESSKKTPLDILKERYAKGEINKKEFGQMKKDLGY